MDLSLLARTMGVRAGISGMTIADRYNLRVLDALEKALDQIDAQQREPDGEEQDLLANAMAYMVCANYRLARVELRKLARPDRSRQATGVPPRSSRRSYTMAMLRRGHLRLGAFV
jgi:hypothetical protein